jgi:hypothetical protein
MTKCCPKISHPRDCQKCLSLANELLRLNALNEEDTKKVKEIAHILQNNGMITEEQANLLNELSDYYLN